MLEPAQRGRTQERLHKVFCSERARKQMIFKNEQLLILKMTARWNL
jgi:hypothetical protein